MSNCGCNNPCQPTPSCECKVRLNSDCITVSGAVFTCSSIDDNLLLTDVLSQLDAFICTKFDQLTTYFALVNVGGGNEVYKGVNGVGAKEIRTLTETGDLIVITQNENTINFTINEDALNDFIQNNQITYSVSNLGTGSPIYIDSTTVLNNIQFNLRSVVSNGFMITEDDEHIYIEPAEISDIPRFIVNQDYIGDEELGTISKPFKTIEAALEAFVGSGTNVSPQFEFATVFVQRTESPYNYTENLNYNKLVFELESGAILSSNPTIGDYLVDYDTMNVLDNIDSTIILNENSIINLQKKGFNNSGTTGIYNTYYKILRVKGAGTVVNLPDSIINPSTKTVFESNYSSTPGYVNPTAAVFAVENIFINSSNSPIVMMGGVLTSIFNNINFQFCSPIGLDMNDNTPVFDLTGGTLMISNSSGLVQKDQSNNIVNTIFRTEELNSNDIRLTLVNSEISGNTDVFLSNISTTSLSTLDFINLNTSELVLTTKFIETDTLNPQPISLKNSIIGGSSVTMFDVNEMIIITNSVNELGSQVVETLPTYASKLDAQIAGLFPGSAFINKKVITTGSFVSGIEYKISNVGDTDFTLIGASANTVGLYFTATGVGGGTTGTADLITRDILI